MLYKKYHRNYVKQFKKGVKFRFKHFPAETVEIKPWWSGRKIYINVNWTLVFPNGRLERGIVII